MYDVDGLPRLLLIGDAFTNAPQKEAIKVAVDAGVQWVQLRDHEASKEVFQDAAVELVRDLRAISAGVHISINMHVGLARQLDAHLHVGRRGPDVLSARNSTDRLLGYSAHSLRDGIVARRHGADYITFSPVFRTKSKPGARPLRLDSLTQICTAVDGFPVVALGGITANRVVECLRSGAHGVAVLSGILYHDDPGMASRDYLSAISNSSSTNS